MDNFEGHGMACPAHHIRPADWCTAKGTFVSIRGCRRLTVSLSIGRPAQLSYGGKRKRRRIEPATDFYVSRTRRQPPGGC